MKLTGTETDFLFLVGHATGVDDGHAVAMDAIEQVVLDHAQSGVELSAIEAFERLGEQERADHIRRVRDDSRGTLLDAARAAAKSISFAELSRRRGEPARARVTQERAWSGWPGGDAA